MPLCAYRRSARDRPYLNEYALQDCKTLLGNIARGRPAGQGMLRPLMPAGACGGGAGEDPLFVQQPAAWKSVSRFFIRMKISVCPVSGIRLAG